MRDKDNMIAHEDWRLQGQDWLREEFLRYMRYRPQRAGSEHDHCEFCWVPFKSTPVEGAAGGAGLAGDGRSPKGGALHEGWVTAENRWICDGCYEDFKLTFDWVVET